MTTALPDAGPAPAIAAVVIGRNEGARLVACLASMPASVARVVYVDSGSTDGSCAAARAAGAEVVELDLARPFTAARARNAGVAALRAPGDRCAFVQFVDGDCMLAPGWVDRAAGFLARTPRAAVACGRRRERFPEASVYNRLADLEWDRPPGPTESCGGDAMMRLDAFDAVGGFDPGLIAGEEPDLCARLHAAGWEIWRLDAEMTLHDAAMTRFGQWWRRSRRAGHAAAEGAERHPRGSDPRRVLRALGWGLLLPGGALAGALATPWALLALPAQVVRLALRAGAGRRLSWEWAVFTMLGKLPEALGIAEYHLRRRLRRRARLIEYK